MNIAMDLIKGEILIHARKLGVCSHGLSNLSLARCLKLMPNHNPEYVEKAFFALCLSGRLPGSRNK